MAIVYSSWWHYYNTSGRWLLFTPHGGIIITRPGIIGGIMMMLSLLYRHYPNNQVHRRYYGMARHTHWLMRMHSNNSSHTGEILYLHFIDRLPPSSLESLCSTGLGFCRQKPISARTVATTGENLVVATFCQN